ncbi:MAG: Monosaccharide-transporting ATPase [Subtercola sp.]|nr:Monosaccharide-transporting ATPase [Subtercola sp.]
MSTEEYALDVRSMTKSFAGKAVLQDFDLTIEPGEIHALLGQNGSGKSTFIKALAGYHEPDAGSFVAVGGKDLAFGSPKDSFALGCRFVHQDLALILDMSVLDNMFMSSSFPMRMGVVDKREGRRRAKRALETVGLDLDLDTFVKDLRPAERTGLAVARALLSHNNETPSVLVLDEPTASLPTIEVQALLATVRRTAAAGVGILYVTHHLDEIPNFAQRVSVLRNGRLVGTWKTAEISHRELVEHLIGEALAAEMNTQRDKVDSDLSASPAIVVSGLQAGRLEDFSISVRPGEIVGLYGLTGSGREEILPAIFGSLSADAGTIVVQGKTLEMGRPDAAIRLGIGYMPPDRKTLGGFMSQTARHNMTLLSMKQFFRGGFLRKKPEVAEAARWFERLNVQPQKAEEALLSTFSGGNQQKILLGKWLRIDPKVMLLDEPSQGVDVGAKLEVHKQIALAATNGTAVIIGSSDVEELASLCERVLVLRDGHVAEELTGARVTVKDINTSFHSDINREGLVHA